MGTTRWTGHPASVAVAIVLGCLLIGCTTPSGPGPESSTPTAAPSTAALSSGSTPSTQPTTISWPPGVITPFRTTEPGSAAGLRIGLISPDATDPFSRTVTDSIITGTTTAGATLIRCDPGADGEFALECAQRLANQRVDGWIVQRSGWDFSSSLCAAGPRDVPMIVVDGPPGRCTTATVTADDTTAGRLAGSSLGEYSRREQDCRFDSFVLIADPTELAASTARAAGIRDGFRQSCPDRLGAAFTTAVTPEQSTSGVGTTATTESVLTPPGTTVPATTSSEPSQQSSTSDSADDEDTVTVIDTADQKSVYDTVQRVIGAHPTGSRILIAAVSDGPAFTAMTAVRAADRLDDVHLVAVGADQRSRCEIASNPHWLGDAALFPDRYGELVVPALVDAMASRSIPQSMLTRPQFLNAATVGSSYEITGCAGTP